MGVGGEGIRAQCVWRPGEGEGEGKGGRGGGAKMGRWGWEGRGE